jgi:hypothetical protein
MDVYNNGKRIVGPDRAISQNPESASRQTHSRRGSRPSRCRAGLVSERSSVTRAHRRGAAPRFRRSTTPVATARAHRAIPGRQIRLCSWLAAGSVLGRSKTVWQRMSDDKSAHIESRPAQSAAEGQGTIPCWACQHHFRRRVRPHSTCNALPRLRDNPGGHPDRYVCRECNFQC